MRYLFSDFILDTEAHALTRDGMDQEVEPLVFDMLRLLIENAGRLVTRDRLVEAIWGGRIVSESAISARIAAVRKAVGDNGKDQRVIRTVSRRGLQFVAKVDVEGAAPAPASGPAAHAQVRFAKAPDGGSIAWAETGSGPAIINCEFFPTHLELDLQQADVRGIIHRFGDYRFIRYDQRGCGLSDWDIPDPGPAARAEEMKLVADAAALNRFAIIARSGGVLAAVAFAARFPEMVSCMILQGGYVDGRAVREGAAYSAENEPIEAMIREGWGKPDSPFMEAYGAVYLPTLSREELRAALANFNQSTNAENMLAVRRAINESSVAEALPLVRAPTLVVHGGRDSVHPVAEARKLAARIEGAELLVLDSPNSVIIDSEPAWEPYMAATRQFLERHAG